MSVKAEDSTDVVVGRIYLSDGYGGHFEGDKFILDNEYPSLFYTWFFINAYGDVDEELEGEIRSSLEFETDIEGMYFKYRYNPFPFTEAPFIETEWSLDWDFYSDMVGEIGTFTVKFDGFEQTYHVIKNPVSVLIGDVDGDKSVTAADALEVLKYAARLIDEINFEAAECVVDGSINASDALAILKYAAKLIPSLPVGELPEDTPKPTEKPELDEDGRLWLTFGDWFKWFEETQYEYMEGEKEYVDRFSAYYSIANTLRERNCSFDEYWREFLELNPHLGYYLAFAYEVRSMLEEAYYEVESVYDRAEAEVGAYRESLKEVVVYNDEGDWIDTYLEDEIGNKYDRYITDEQLIEHLITLVWGIDFSAPLNEYPRVESTLRYRHDLYYRNHVDPATRVDW